MESDFYFSSCYSTFPAAAAAAAKSLQLCLTLCHPIHDSPPGSPVPGILQARTLEWVAISFSNAWKWKVKVKSLSPVRLLATPWTAAYKAPLSMGLSRQEYWSGLPLLSPTFPEFSENNNFTTWKNFKSCHHHKWNIFISFVTFLAGQWLRLHTYNARGHGFHPW